MRHGHPSSDRQATVSIPELVQQLPAVDQTLPEALQTQILTTGSAVVPDLIAILEDTLADDETDHGWLPSHAAKLLGQIGDEQARADSDSAEQGADSDQGIAMQHTSSRSNNDNGMLSLHNILTLLH